MTLQKDVSVITDYILDLHLEHQAWMNLATQEYFPDLLKKNLLDRQCRVTTVNRDSQKDIQRYQCKHIS